ncbi:CBS domain-containing protein [Lichenicoccus roseus]|nr:CBS domain-containing protein [Lichenicoccus roseus]
MSIPLRNILSRKGWGAVTVTADASLLTVADTLVLHHIGAAVVVDRDGRPIGLVSERDIVRGVSEHHDDVVDVKVGDVMARNVPSLSPDDSSLKAVQLMTIHRHRHIPVLEDEALVGMVSIGDVVKYRIEESESAVEAMRAYVMQSDPTEEPGLPRHALD